MIRNFNILQKQHIDNNLPSYPSTFLPSKKAFTLSEVLITLGVIGVVAALTMPTLIKHYQQHATVNKLKSTYTILNNAIERAKSDYDTDVNSWFIPNGTTQEMSDYFAEHYLMPYLKITKDCNHNSIGMHCSGITKFLNNKGSYGSDENRTFILTNGSKISVNIASDNSNYRIKIYMFVNGDKGNILGKDVFCIELSGTTSFTGNKNKFLPYGMYVSRSSLTSATTNQACNKAKTGLLCFALIMHDGWKIEKDYPW